MRPHFQRSTPPMNSGLHLFERHGLLASRCSMAVVYQTKGIPGRPTAQMSSSSDSVELSNTAAINPRRMCLRRRATHINQNFQCWNFLPPAPKELQANRARQCAEFLLRRPEPTGHDGNSLGNRPTPGVLETTLVSSDCHPARLVEHTKKSATQRLPGSRRRR